MARYHYNPDTGKVGPCRADPSKPNSRGCRFKLSEDEHFSSAAAASSAYEATQEALPLPVSSAKDRRLSSAQRAHFSESAVRDADGELLEVHHGSTQDFDSFDPARLGRGNDSWGNGFYFTTDKGRADGYAEGNGSRDFYLNVKNPLRIDGKKNLSLVAVEFSAEQNEEILLAHPDLMLQPGESDERSNPLEDYAPDYWDRDHHEPAELRAMAKRVSREYFQDAGWVELESFYGRENGQAFLQAVNKQTGYDGVEVDFGEEEGKHFVAWFPEQIKLSSNRNPTGKSARVDS